jgi:hypothetical protein
MEEQLQLMLADLHVQLQEARVGSNTSDVERIRKQQSDCLAMLMQRAGAHAARAAHARCAHQLRACAPCRVR